MANHNLEFNKLFAAILVAGIVAMLAGFVSKKLVHTEKLKEDAFPIEVAEVQSSSGPAKPAGPEPILALLAGADIEKGKKLSRACAACHSFDKGGAHRVGPYQWGVVGKDIGAKPGYAYSDTLANAEGAWTYQNLNAFLWKPKKSYPGTKMNYIGLKKPQDRADLIAWLRTLSDSPIPLPTAEEIAAETVD